MSRFDPDASVPLNTGRTIPLLGFGTWQLDGRQAYDAVREALSTGYRHVDTATGYGNEREVGRAIRDSGLPREELFVTTKLPPDNAGREQATIEESLRNLGLDHVDLWLIHWPPGGAAGVETWRRFLELRDQGKTTDVGVSNYDASQIATLVEATGEAPAVNQIKWSPSLYDASRLQQSREARVVLEGYSPLRASDLADSALEAIAGAHGVTPAQVILRWHLETGVPVIPKSARPERIRANFEVFGFDLSPEEVAQLNRLGS